MGATSTDHGHPSATTADLDASAARALFDRIVRGHTQPGDAELFRGQVLTEMARMSLDDGLVMQIHPGAWRNHNARAVRSIRAECRRRYSDGNRLRRRTAAATQSIRQRQTLSHHRLYAG